MKRNQKWAALLAAAVLTASASTAWAEGISGNGVSKTFTNETFTGGELYADDGATLNINGGTVDVNADQFTTEGGTINATGTTIRSGVWANSKGNLAGTVTLKNCTISGNIGAWGDEAFLTVDGGKLEADTISGKGSSRNGGSIKIKNATGATAKQVNVEGGQVSIGNGTELTSNSAAISKEGLIMVSEGGKYTVTGNVSADGAAIALEKSEMTAGSLTLTNGAGLEVFEDGASFSVTGETKISGKSAITIGYGAAFGKFADITVEGVNEIGSSIYVAEGGTLTSGALNATNAKIEVSNTGASYTFTGGKVSGGGLYAYSGGMLTINDATISANFGTHGGTINMRGGNVTNGLYVWYDGTTKGTANFDGTSISGESLEVRQGSRAKVTNGTVTVDSVVIGWGLEAKEVVTVPAEMMLDGGSLTAKYISVSASGILKAANGATLKTGQLNVLDNEDQIGINIRGKGTTITADKVLAANAGMEIADGAKASLKDVQLYENVVFDVQGDGTVLDLDKMTMHASQFNLSDGAQATSKSLDLDKSSLLVSGTDSRYTVEGKVDIYRSSMDAVMVADEGTIIFTDGSELHISGAESGETTNDAAGIALMDLARDGNESSGALSAVNHGKIIFENGSSVYTKADENHVVETVATADETSGIIVNDGAQLFVSNVTNAEADGKTEYDFSSVFEGSDAVFKKIYGETIRIQLNEDGKTFGEAKNISTVLPDTFAAEVFTAASDAGNGTAYDFVTKALGRDGDSDEKRTEYLNQAAGLTGLSGVAHGMYGFSQRVSGLIDRHEADGEGIWAAYLREDKTVDGLEVGSLAADYDFSYNGFILGGDFAKTETSRTGAAFAYADGDISSNGGVVTTKNDVKYYAGEIYHVIRSGDMTYKADIGYARGSNDISQYNLGTKVTADLHATALHAGIRAEKAIETASGTWAPYIGLDYFHVSTDNYTDSLGFAHDMDSANIWNIPVGVQYRHETRSGSWTLSPIVEVGYLFALGDKDTEESFGYGSATSTFRSDIAENSFIGRLGFAAKKDSMSYELHYGYQKGSDVKSNQWGVQISYTF